MSLASFKSIPLHSSQLSLAAVLKCGQSFRWSMLTSPPASPPEANHGDRLSDDSSGLPSIEYRFCLKDRVICLRQSPEVLYYRSVFPSPPQPTELPKREAETLEWLRDYLQLDVDLNALYKQWSTNDKVFAKLQDRFEGIRMLRQDPWENLVSFICSSNNNISRITKMVQNLCLHYSPPLLSMEHPFSPSERFEYHPFPSPSALANPNVTSHLRSLGFGYRADYIQRTAQMLVGAHGVSTSVTPFGTAEASEIWLKELRKKGTIEAREELLKFVGVGRKVADCVLLMSMDKAEVVPVDTHVYQIAVKHYGLKSLSSGKATMTPRIYEEINTKFLNIWGKYAGWAHSILFTADLKSFSTYGLPPPSPSPVKSTGKKRTKITIKKEIEIVPLLTPADSPLKRKLEKEGIIDKTSPTIPDLCVETEIFTSIVERVKKRRKDS